MFIYLAIPFTLIIYFSSRRLYQFKPWAIFNPVLVSIAALIALLYFAKIDFFVYEQGTYPLHILLEPAIVALAIPLYSQLSIIKPKFKKILIACLSSVFIAFFSAFYIMPLLGADLTTAASFAGQSVTTPIAVEISRSLNGVIALTATMVIFAGIIGASIGISFLKLVGVKNKLAIGLAIGSASHALGTAKMVDVDPESGAMSSVALIVCAILSALIMPVLYFVFIQ